MSNFNFRPAVRECKLCGYTFTIGRKKDQQFCSSVCRNTNNARVSAERRGDMQRGSGTKWYVKQGGRHQHRIVAEAMLGRKLVRGEIVHHKDGNKKNNAPNNLVVMLQGEHMREHGMGIPGVAPAHKPWEARLGK